jgi:hypothetical protein
MGTNESEVNRDDEGEQMCLMYFVFLYESRTMKLGEIILRRGQRMKNNGHI